MPVLLRDGQGNCQVVGPVNVHTAAALARFRFDPGVVRYTIDLTDMEAFDSGALALFLGWKRQAARRGCRLAFVRFPPGLRALAALYDLEQLFLGDTDQP